MHSRAPLDKLKLSPSSLTNSEHRYQDINRRLNELLNLKDAEILSLYEQILEL